MTYEELCKMASDIFTRDKDLHEAAEAACAAGQITRKEANRFRPIPRHGVLQTISIQQEDGSFRDYREDELTWHYAGPKR